MEATETLVGSVVEVGKAVAGLGAGNGAVIVPRLVVRGNGSTGVQVLNLQLTNIGAAAAFGIFIGVPWHQVKGAGTKLGGATYWWRRHSPWFLRVLGRLGIWRRLPKSLRYVWMQRVQLRTVDVGLILAPGESTEIYFGQAGVGGQGFRAKGAGGIYWQMGSITTLTLSWFEGQKRWSPWLLRKTTQHKFAIHSHPGVEVSAHQRWA